jgi:hypothetical protein
MSRNYRAVAILFGVALVVFALPGRAAGPFQFHSLTPCRVLDTRDAPYGTPLPSDIEAKFQVQDLCGVPNGAAAVTLNVTAVAPTDRGRLTLYPSGIGDPGVSTINFPPGTTALANGAIVPLADYTTFPAEDLTVLPHVVAAGTVHVVLDVTGYFE